MPVSDPRTPDLLAALEAWREDAASFHGDRQLSDRVLLAAGWRCLPDPGHPTGERWEFGTNPVYSAWPPYHAHPVQRLDDAIGQMPAGWRLCRMEQIERAGHWSVMAVRDGLAVQTSHPSLPVAVCMAVVKAEAAHAH